MAVDSDPEEEQEDTSYHNDEAAQDEVKDT